MKAWEDQRPYDLIFMDMQMPEMDGYTATSHLRDKGYKGPVIALTAHTMATDRAKCLACGCDDYSSKPINVPELLSLAENYIEKAGEMWGDTFNFVPFSEEEADVSPDPVLKKSCRNNPRGWARAARRCNCK